MTARMPWILGLSESHNGSACLLQGDKVVVAIQEERLTRSKRQVIRAGRDALCIRYCLDYAGIGVTDLDVVAIALLGNVEKSLARLRKNPLLRDVPDTTPFLGYTHHRCHAAYGAAIAGVATAAVLVADGMGSCCEQLSDDERQAVRPLDVIPQIGEQSLWESISIYEFQRGELTPRFKQLATWVDDAVADKRDRKAQAVSMYGLGGMYERSSRAIFAAAQESGKVMGLAPLGEPILPVEEFHSVNDDGTLAFRNPAVLRADNLAQAVNQSHLKEGADLAASVQQALEHGMLHYARLSKTLTRADTLVLSGGVALNGVANEKIIRTGVFTKVHLPPAVEDCGNAVGAAYLALWQCYGWRQPTPARVDALGRDYDDADVDAAVAANPLVRAQHLGDGMIEEAVERLMAGQIIGWFQGRSEFGPRALGQRSILCDPRPADAKDRLNARVKRREAFRPFAPLVLADFAAEWFDLTGPDGKEVDADGPFMTRVVPIHDHKQALIPAVTHVDGTGRFQTVGPENGAIHDLLMAFYRHTGVPVLLNTSFNLANEPIVESPSDALLDLLITDIDAVLIKDRLVTRLPGREPGILDLVPILVADKMDQARVARDKLASHSVKMGEGEFMDLYFNAHFPLGDMPVRIHKSDMMILTLLNGQRCGWELLALMEKFAPQLSVNARWLETRIASLARLRLIELNATRLGCVRLVN